MMLPRNFPQVQRANLRPFARQAARMPKECLHPWSRHRGVDCKSIAEEIAAEEATATEAKAKSQPLSPFTEEISSVKGDRGCDFAFASVAVASSAAISSAIDLQSTPLCRDHGCKHSFGIR